MLRQLFLVLLLATITDTGHSSSALVELQPTLHIGSYTTHTVRSEVATRHGAALAIAVAAPDSPLRGRFIDGKAQYLRLIGMNLSGLQYVPIADAATRTNWGTQLDTADGFPDFAALARWHANSVRIPLHEASWNADGPHGSCRDIFGRRGKAGVLINPDRLGRYRADVSQAVEAARKAGFYVILNLHNAAPADFCSTGDRMVNSDNSIRFWTSVAGTFKGARHVLFELYNEPHNVGDRNTDLRVRQRLEFFSGNDSSGKSKTYSYEYLSSGWNELIAAIRSTGASNVVLVGSQVYSSDNSKWLEQLPNDRTPPAGFTGTWTPQLAAAWHTYPRWATSPGDPNYLTMRNRASLDKAKEIIAAGYPVVVTEFSDRNDQAPFVQHWLPQFDAAGLSYLAWAWSPPTNIHEGLEFQLTMDGSGTPTPGLGKAVFEHYRCLAMSPATRSCP